MTRVISRDQLYDALVRFVGSVSDNFPEDKDLNEFAFSMRLSPGGVSLDQAIGAAYDVMVPPEMSSVDEAVQFGVMFLQKELVEFWKAPTSKLLVAALSSAAAAESDRKFKAPRAAFLSSLQSSNI